MGGDSEFGLCCKVTGFFEAIADPCKRVHTQKRMKWANRIPPFKVVTSEVLVIGSH